MAKLIIKLIHHVAAMVNEDPGVGTLLKVVFLPNYRVTLAETIIPGTDLSEQISTAGTEASGTSNMKFTMNGALTIGTLDGANIEIRESVGEDNFYVFGLTAEQVVAQRPLCPSHQLFESDALIHGVVNDLLQGRFCPGELGAHRDICSMLLQHGDYYMHLADLHSYLAAHAQAEQDYQHRHIWAQKALLNIARSGKFTSDRSIGEYARRIWKIAPTLE